MKGICDLLSRIPLIRVFAFKSAKFFSNEWNSVEYFLNKYLVVISTSTLLYHSFFPRKNLFLLLKKISLYDYAWKLQNKKKCNFLTLFNLSDSLGLFLYCHWNKKNKLNKECLHSTDVGKIFLLNVISYDIFLKFTVSNYFKIILWNILNKYVF